MAETKERQRTKLDVQKVMAELRERLTDGEFSPCVVCGHTRWAMDDGIAAVDVSSNVDEMSNKDGRDMYFPLVSLICDNCGNTHFINAKILGIA